MKRFLSALLALLFLVSSAAASAILTTRPLFDKQYKPESANLLECARKPMVQTFFVWPGFAGATFTWTGNDEPTLWIWGPEQGDEISGIVIKRGDAYFKIDMEELISTAPGPCDLP